MAAAEHNIIIEQGADYIRTLTIRDGGGVIVDLSTGLASDFKGDIRRAHSGPLATSFTMTFVTDGTDGSILISLTDDQTNALEYDTKYIYDIFWVKPEGIVERLLEGEVSVVERITRF